MLSDKYGFNCLCKRCVTHDDEDLDFERYWLVSKKSINQLILELKYRSLKRNVRNEDVNYWDQVLHFERRIYGNHSSTISESLFGKFQALCQQITSELYRKNPRKAKTKTKRVRQLAKELEDELFVSHGRDHPRYQEITGIIGNFEIVAEMHKL